MQRRLDQLVDLLRYKAWALARIVGVVEALPPEEALKSRATPFGNMVHTMNHVWVVEDIFRHHVQSRRHSYTARNMAAPPPLPVLRERMAEMDAWWLDHVTGLDPRALDDVVEFEFVGGGEGRMTRAEILLHLVNHATYHRGFVVSMIYEAGATPPATDLPVYIRERDGRS